MDSSSSYSSRILGTNDVLPVPIRADKGAGWDILYDHDDPDYPKWPSEYPFVRVKSKLPFLVLHAAAPNVGEDKVKDNDLKEFNWVEGGKFHEDRYLRAYYLTMTNVFKAA